MNDPVPQTRISEERAHETAEAQAQAQPEPAPAPLEVPRAPTGNAEVDAVLARLGDADRLATDGHLEVYEDVHQGLRDTLTALDTRPGPPGPTPRPTPPPGPSGHPSESSYGHGNGHRS